MRKLGLVIVGLVLLGSNAWAFRGDCGIGRDGATGLQSMSVLNLSEDQKSLIQARQEVFMEEMSPLRNEIFTKTEELRQLWSKPDPDHSMITAKQEEIRGIQAQVQEMTNRHRLGCLSILTPDQREKLGTLTAYPGGGRPERGLQGMADEQH